VADENWPGGVYGLRGEINTWDWRALRWKTPLRAEERTASSPWVDVPPAVLARAIVADLVSRNIRELGQILRVVESPTRFVLGYTFAALIEVVYWHVARIAEQGDSVGRGEACGQYFHRTHGKQRYCPASDTWAESRCGRNARARRERTSEKR